MTTTLAPPPQQFTTRKLHPTFGLEIVGLDVSKPLDASTIATLTALSAEHKLLVFKNQTLSAEKLNAFAGLFGDTNQIPPKVSGSRNRDRDHNVSRLGNQDDADKPHVAPTGYGAVARFWHTDSSWRPIPTWLTFLAAVELPDADGDTGFADMQAAYEALSDERKALLEGKSMIHSWRTLRRYEPTIPAMGDDENVPQPSTHPLVRTVNGRKSLFLNGHVSYYVGNMPFEDGEALFNELMAHATSPAFVYQHKWSIGDVAMWDDRTTMHRAMPYDTRQRRVMHRAEVLGVEPPR
jgi:alpha-ketoglutarate-dependent taurine dioxygenase